MDDWSTIPNRNADREPAPHPTRPLKPETPRPPTERDPTHCQTQPAASSAPTGAHRPLPSTTRLTHPASPGHTTTNPGAKPRNPLYPPRKPTVTSINHPQNDADPEPPLDTTRPFMDDNDFSISEGAAFIGQRADGPGAVSPSKVQRTVSGDRTWRSSLGQPPRSPRMSGYRFARADAETGTRPARDPRPPRSGTLV
jgi:hypothetical protein